MASWDTAYLRQHICSLGEPERSLVEVVDSIGRYNAIFIYHLESARDAMKGIIRMDDPHGIENLRLVFGDSERQDEFYLAKIASEANILGCIHSTRAIFDVFSHLVNGLLLGGRLSAKQCNIEAAAGMLEHSALKRALEDLLNSYWFSYVKSFVNTAKHRRLVQHGLHVSFVDSDAGIRISAFEYEGSSFPSYSVEELLAGVLDAKNRIVDCGRALNARVITDGA